jgi:hypothetical protein
MKKPDNIKDTLFDYVTDESKWFYWYHSPKRLEALFCQDHEQDIPKKVWRFKSKLVITKEGKEVEIEENLADFFDAVLDEVRLKKANAFAEYALYISDNDDLAYFRNTVAKREIVADIDYNKQRDHAVHTLYNYLLGWYIFEHSSQLQAAFISYFEGLDILTKNVNNEPLLNSYAFMSKEPLLNSYAFDTQHSPDVKIMVLMHEFADVWHIVSLLHDIGYILEGNLSSASPNVEHDRVTNGSKIIHDYFNHYFWKSFEVDFRGAKNIAKILGVAVPDFKSSESLASLGDRLCDIGNCENIRKELVEKERFKNKSNNKPIQQLYGLNREAFSIWNAYYKFYENKKMENILYIVERVYKNWMWVGSDYGGRNLDHGVCSGLITLQALTFFRELYWGFYRTEWESGTPVESKNREAQYFSKLQDVPPKDRSNCVSKELFTSIRIEIIRVPKRIRLINKMDNGDSDSNLQPDFWFKKILWATASSAIHALVQKPEYSKQYVKRFGEENSDNSKIGFEDDPLAFLGVFVDGLQEWDRYKVTGRGEAAFAGDEPLQSTEVYLYPNKAELEKSCYAKKCANKSCKVKENDKKLNDDSIYLTYPEGDNKKKWIDEINKTMDRGLKGERNIIVEIVACSNNGSSSNHGM